MLSHGAEGFVQRGLMVGKATLLVVHLGIAQSQLDLVGGRLQKVGVFGVKVIGLRMHKCENAQHR